jgi:hypothetical protein
MISQTSGEHGSATRLPETASIELFAIELSPTVDGRYFVGIEATICEAEGELSQMDLGHHRVASVEEALAAIRRAVMPCYPT